MPVPIACTQAGASWLLRGGRLLGAAASPLFMVALFYAQATDNLAHTAELAMAKYGDDPRYVAYVADTPLVVPTLASITTALFGGNGSQAP